MEKLQQFRVPLITAVAAILLAVVVYMAWIAPEGSKLSTLRSQQTQLQVEQERIQTEIAMLKREKANLGPTCATLTRDVTEVPGTPEVDSFLQQVTALAVESGDPNTPSISVTQAAPDTETTGNGGTEGAPGTTAVAVQFSLVGTYGQMSAFLKGLYTFPRLFTISQLSVGGSSPVASGGGAPAASDPNYNLSLSGDVYYSTGQADACTAPK